MRAGGCPIFANANYSIIFVNFCIIPRNQWEIMKNENQAELAKIRKNFLGGGILVHVGGQGCFSWLQWVGSVMGGPVMGGPLVVRVCSGKGL